MLKIQRYLQIRMNTDIQNNPLWVNLKQKYAAQKMQMLNSGTLTINGKTIQFVYKLKGNRPPKGYTLIFGFHGGGGCPKQTNDGQYNNHKNLYNKQLPDGSIWFTPRSAEDVWDMWFRPYMEDFIFEWIRAFSFNNMIDVNKIFLTGYSAGGDGVYHMAPRMADYLAGGAMMAGHPNGVNQMNIRNIGYSVQVGGQDNAYNRKNEAIKYIRMLNQLGQNYGGYKHQSRIHDGKPHWMATQDAAVFPWLFNLSRDPYPDTILFKQHPRRKRDNFYYISFGAQKSGKQEEQIIVFKEGNSFRLFGNRVMSVMLNRAMINPSLPVSVFHNNQFITERPFRPREDIAQKTLIQRMDPYYIFEDQIVSEPPVVIDMNTVFCNQFGMSQAEKEAEYEPGLPMQLDKTPSTFITSLVPRVQRQRPIPDRKEKADKRKQINKIDQQREALQNYQNQNARHVRDSYEHEQPLRQQTIPYNQQTMVQNQWHNQQVPNYQNQSWNQGQYQQGQPYNQYQQGQAYNPYNQALQQQQMKRKPDSCCNFY